MPLSPSMAPAESPCTLFVAELDDAGALPSPLLLLDAAERHPGPSTFSLFDRTDMAALRSPSTAVASWALDAEQGGETDDTASPSARLR